MTEVIRVKIGEVVVGRQDQILKATLGSCIGITFFDVINKKSALAHCLLPEGSVPYTIGAKYINQALDSLISLMKVRDRDHREFIVSYCGGANMMAQIRSEAHNQIGSKNLDAIRFMLKKYKFKIRELDCADNYGRQMSIDCSTGKVVVSRLSNG